MKYLTRISPDDVRIIWMNVSDLSQRCLAVERVHDYVDRSRDGRAVILIGDNHGDSVLTLHSWYARVLHLNLYEDKQILSL